MKSVNLSIFFISSYRHIMSSCISTLAIVLTISYHNISILWSMAHTIYMRHYCFHVQIMYHCNLSYCITARNKVHYKKTPNQFLSISSKIVLIIAQTKWNYIKSFFKGAMHWTSMVCIMRTYPLTIQYHAFFTCTVYFFPQNIGLKKVVNNICT